MTEPDATVDATVTFNVKASSGPKLTLTLPTSTTIADLKTKLAEPDMANVPTSSQRLIYSGKVLKDADTLSSCAVKEGNTMHLVRSAASNQRQNPTASSTPATSATSTTPAPPTGVPSTFAAGTGNDILAGLTGARYAGMPGLPSLESLAQQPSQEEIMRRLEDPNFAQQMNEALSNPQMIDMMINMNPQLRAMGPQARQMLQSDHFRRMMTNPQMMRQMIEMQRSMGDNPFGMGGGQSAFPMPGTTNTTDPQHQSNDNTQTSTQNNAPNPFAAFGGGAGAGGGFNPFMMMQPPPVGSDRAANPMLGADNPFAALFNVPPATSSQPGQTTSTDNPGANTGTTPGDAASNTNTTPAGRVPNPFADNPMLAGMYNNPMMQQMTQQMMQNPEAMRNAMQMLFGGNSDSFDGLGGAGAFGAAPPDNRPPEERYATQLRQLNEMGLHDFDKNVQALGRSGGDVNGALEWLFSQPPS